MNDRVKVGLDEWMVADAAKADLMTDGLSGCVAVCLSGNGRVALSHVYSGCDASNWATYKEQLDTQFTASGLGDPSKIKAVLVCNQGDNPSATPGQESGKDWLPQQLKRWLAEKDIAATIQQDNGCRISASGDSLTCTLKKDDTADFYRYDYKTSRDEGGGVVLNQDISSKPIPAGLPTIRPSERVETAVSLDQSAHPANGLYRDILAKLPADSDLLIGHEGDRTDCYSAKQGAAALTVACLEKGIFGSVNTVEQHGDKTIAGQGSMPESRVYASVVTDDAVDLSMKHLSARAAKLQNDHDAPSQTQTTPVATQDVGTSVRHV
ncbi:hypothetical protein [Pseudomonas sp. CGJS7]|uniref:hypothetical protein n=1 Tax=Pseudomonas sp. CGJS7 TaxID=3109348 RepID=UPI003009784C